MENTTMITIHYISGVLIALFVGMHLLNHLLAWRSNQAHIQFMQSMRRIYRNRIVETVLFAAVGIQVLSGITLAIEKMSKAEQVFDWLQISSGLYLSLFLVIHIAAILNGRYKLGMDTNLYFGAGYLNVSPQRYFFIPYYSFAILSFCTHIACVHRVKITPFVGEQAAEMHAWVLLALGLLLTLMIMLKLCNLSIPPDAFDKPSGQQPRH